MTLGRLGLVLTMLASVGSARAGLPSASPKPEPERGDPAPAITLTTTDHKQVDTAHTDRVLVLLFGETRQVTTDRSVRLVAHALDQARAQGVDARWLWVLSKGSDPRAAAAALDGLENRPGVVHDTTREAFGAFEIISLPAVVVLDPQHRFVHMLPGLTPRFAAVVESAVLLAGGEIEPEAFARTLHPEPVVTNEARDKARQVTLLARKAAQRGLDELALTQYARAIEIDPSYETPRVEFGHLRIAGGDLDGAERVFGELLRLNPDSVEGRLGRASVLVERGGEGLAEAETIARDVLRSDRDHPRALFVLGQVQQARGETDAATASFRASAEALFGAMGAAGTP